MWKLLEGVKPPEKKVKLSDADRNERQRERRNRGFLTEWKEKFKWFVYDESLNEMKCSVCVKYESSGNMVKGCNNFRHSTLVSHNDSEVHRQNIKKDEAMKKPPGTSIAEKTCESINKAAFTKLRYLFRNAHYVAKHARPYTDFVSICLLDKAKGLDVGDPNFRDSKTSKEVELLEAEPTDDPVVDNIEEVVVEEQEEEKEEEADNSPLLGLLETDLIDGDGDIDDMRDAMKLQRRSYKLLLSMMD